MSLISRNYQSESKKVEHLFQWELIEVYSRLSGSNLLTRLCLCETCRDKGNVG